MRELLRSEPVDGGLPPTRAGRSADGAAEWGRRRRRGGKAEEAVEEEVHGGVAEGEWLAAGGEDDGGGLRAAEDAELRRLLEEARAALREGHLAGVVTLDLPYLDLTAALPPSPAGLHRLRRKTMEEGARRRRRKASKEGSGGGTRSLKK